MDKWRDGAPPRGAVGFYLIQFEHGDRFDVVEGKWEEGDENWGEEKHQWVLNSQQTTYGGHISDPVKSYLPIPNPN